MCYDNLPTPKYAPALIESSFEYDKASNCEHPSSTSHKCNKPIDATTLILSAGLVLNIHGFSKLINKLKIKFINNHIYYLPGPSESKSNVSLRKPTLTNAFTNVSAKFCFAESTFIFATKIKIQINIIQFKYQNQTL